MRFFLNKTGNRGYTLIEIIVYIAIFGIVALVVINGIIVSMRTFVAARENRILARTSVDMMERMSREIRAATSIEPLSSTLDMSPGTLGVYTIEDEDTTLIEFDLDNGSLILSEDSAEIGSLSTDNITVTSLVFREITTTQGTAVRIEMTIESSITGKSIDLYNTVGLRGSY